VPESDQPVDSTPITQAEDTQEMQEVTETHPDSEGMAVTHSETISEPIKEPVSEEVVYEQIDTSSEP